MDTQLSIEPGSAELLPAKTPRDYSPTYRHRRLTLLRCVGPQQQSLNNQHYLLLVLFL